MSDLAEIVRDMGELFRTHVEQQNKRIRELTDRVQDLEGHAEHGPDGECGVCAPDGPETVGADEYGTRDIVISDFEDRCLCSNPIMFGDELVQKEGKWFHRECAG